MGSLKLHQSKKDIQEVNIKIWVKENLKKQNLNMSKLSLMMGMSHTYLNYKTNMGDFKCSELIILGNYLEANPFEPYIHLLKGDARYTLLEKQQAARIAELEQKISDLEKERDWLKEVVMRK